MGRQAKQEHGEAKAKHAHHQDGLAAHLVGEAAPDGAKDQLGETGGGDSSSQGAAASSQIVDQEGEDGNDHADPQHDHDQAEGQQEQVATLGPFHNLTYLSSCPANATPE